MHNNLRCSHILAAIGVLYKNGNIQLNNTGLLLDV